MDDPTKIYGRGACRRVNVVADAETRFLGTATADVSVVERRPESRDSSTLVHNQPTRRELSSIQGPASSRAKRVQARRRFRIEERR